TSHITQNIASVPFLWVLPLTLYLLTFVLAFEGRGGRGLYDPRWGIYVAVAFAVAMAAGLSVSRGVLDVTLAVPLYCAGLFFGCLFCHGELASRKPAPGYLTQFYLAVAAGGAAGGLFVGLVAPRIFPAYYELPLALFALTALAVLAAWTDRRLVGPWVVSTALTAAAATAATAYYGWVYRDFLRNDVIVMQRNFYGTLRVREQGTGEAQMRRLLHGVILHGEQPTRAANRLEPGSYYARSSGVGLAIAARQQHGPIRLGVVGLGVGTLSAYGRAGDTVRFYELDPDVLAIARREFGYLDASAAKLEFVIGDARLSLERELAAGQPQRYDVLAIDAFSSDSIPVHLITREAVELYRRHLAPGGIIAVHISNRFLDLKPVLANIAAALGLVAVHVADSPSEESGASSTDWVLLAVDAAALSHPPLAARSERLAPQPGLSLWTDQFNNLIDVLKTRPLAALKDLLFPQ
ncbi:MAG TPA: fused MFS/spermidine synthase, partial [Burkholderiaceae bacterium]|nr:fused MFS/spermidine synthase [Burkholderiaceae bacterium]